MANDVRSSLSQKVRANEALLVDICSKLVKIPSESPLSDTREIAKFCGEILSKVPGVEITYYTLEEPIVNIVARIKGNGPGKRMVFSGHLDTFPAGDKSLWTVDPFGGVIKDGRIYGRGAADMKGGFACSMLAFLLMAECRDAWSGELVIVLTGDEEIQGPRGTGYVLDTVPHCTGDVTLIGDIGTSKVLRFGERGALWFEITAIGKASHGAFVHKGVNAIFKMIDVISKIRQEWNQFIPVQPPNVVKAIVDAGPLSEQFGGKGETEALLRSTLNIAVFEASTVMTMMPDKAVAKGDIKVPPGLTTAMVEDKLKKILDEFGGVSMKVINRYEPTWSDPDHEIFKIAAKNSGEVWQEKVGCSMRLGGSDARYFRARHIPTVNCGLNGFNLGAADEYAEIYDMVNVAEIHVLTAFDYLTKKP